MKKILFLLLISLQVSAQYVMNPGVNNIPDGNYNMVTLNSGVLIVKGDVFISNLSGNQSRTTILVESGGKLTLPNLHINSGLIFINRGTTIVQGSLELQNNSGRLINSGKIEFAEAQINDNTSTIELEGCNSTFDVKGSFNLNTTKVGALTLKDGANVTTTNLNIGGANTVAGKGLIKVKHINLNHNLTTSSEINLCYKGHLNQPEKLGAANLSCDAVLCFPLPVKVSQVLFKKKDDMIEWEFNLIDADGTDSFDVMLSDDAKIWSTVLHVEIDKVNPNKKYSGTIKLKLK